MRHKEKSFRRQHFSLVDYIIIAMLAAIGIAIKVVIVPLAHIITGPLFIPGGVLAGGFYMMFLVMGMALVKKRGAAFAVSLIQAVLVTISGTLGSHGAASIITYTVPGLVVELWFFISRHKGCCTFCCFVGGMLANMAGSFTVNLAIFNLPFVPLMLSLSVSALSGGLGGLVANMVARNVERLGIIKNNDKESEA